MSTIPLSTSTKSSSGFATKLLIWVLVAIVTLVFCLFVYIPNCRVQGFEFNPKTWQVRHFEFWAEPFTNIQVSGILHDTTRISIDPSIVRSLNQASTIDPTADRWDLVELRDYHPFPSQGPAAVAIDLLTTHKYGWGARPIQFWNTWTTKNPKKAPPFWQAAQILTIHHAYFAVPDLLDLALVSDNEFAQSLNDTMSGALLEQARFFQTQGDLPSATAAAQAGLQYDANNQELKNFSLGQF